MESARSRTICRAVKALGSEKALADALGVSVEAVKNWVDEVGAPDDGAYFAALDIVAVGPLFPGRMPKAKKN
jgi:DNA-binding transcriptional regulator YiaG